MSVKDAAVKLNNERPVVLRKSNNGLSFYDKLGFLYFLNIIDWLCTEALLLTGRFHEANPLMNIVITGFVPALIIKAVLPLGITALCFLIYRLGGEEENKFADVVIYIGIVLYALINLWHIFNFVLLFFVF